MYGCDSDDNNQGGFPDGGGGSPDGSKNDGTVGNDAGNDAKGNDATGNDATGNDAGGNDATGNDSSTADTGGDDSAASDSGTGGDSAAEGGSNKVNLIITNLEDWCSVTVNGGTASTDPTITVEVTKNTVVSLHGDTKDAASFKWGYWIGTASDPTAHVTDMTTTVMVGDSDKTIQVCCPLNGGTSC
jgi:hypothetical protein